MQETISHLFPNPGRKPPYGRKPFRQRRYYDVVEWMSDLAFSFMAGMGQDGSLRGNRLSACWSGGVVVWTSERQYVSFGCPEGKTGQRRKDELPLRRMADGP